MFYDQIPLSVTKDFCRCSLKSTFHYVAMPMMTWQILKSVDFTKTEKSRYLEKETLVFLQINNSLITDQGLFYGKT